MTQFILLLDGTYAKVGINLKCLKKLADSTFACVEIRCSNACFSSRMEMVYVLDVCFGLSSWSP